MAKKMKKVKVKEPVKIRTKALANGSQSVYLDTYMNGVRSYEFLKLYLRPERTAEDRQHNRDVMELANTMKVRRMTELLTGRSVASVAELSRTLLADYLERYKEECGRTHRGNSYLKMCQNMENHLRDFMGRRLSMLRMKDVDVALCRQFAAYLSTAETCTGQRLSRVSVYHYFSAFRNLMGEAVKDGLIAQNPVELLKKGELPKRPEVKKDFLDVDEVVMMAEVPCSREVVKQAFMFCCFTGLRYSDVSRLRWTDIRRQGDGWRLQIMMQKTQELIQCKLSEEAVAWMPAPPEADSSGLVFQLPSLSSVERAVRKWAAEAGIKKHVTFHTSRHSYATMALMAGADLYTISKLLGHRDINTTTIYAAVVDAKRDAAVDGVSDLFRKRKKSR